VFAGCLALVSLLTGPAAFAQQGPPGPPNADARAERMKAQIEEVIEKLELDEPTSESVRTILTEQSDKQAALLQSYAGQGRDAMPLMREEMQDIRLAANDRLKGVLSEEKLALYEQLQAEMRENMRGQFGGGRRGQ
jgi:hypothetical protein